jgi:6-phosphogluconolactonase (cycloisomerase 2 family)
MRLGFARHFGWIGAALVLSSGAAHGSARITTYTEGEGLFAADTVASGAAIALAPNGGWLYVAGGADDALASFARDPLTGILRGVAPARDGVDGVDGLESGVAVAVSPDSRFVYVASDGAVGKVSAFERVPGIAPLVFREVQADGIAGVADLSGPRRIAVAPGGAHLLVLADEHVVVFARAADGTLEFVESEPIPGSEPRDFFVSSDGRHVYVLSQNGTITTLARSAQTGALTHADSFSSGSLPLHIRGTRSGAHVFVADFDDRMRRYERDSVTGLLTPLDTVVLGPTYTFVAMESATDRDRLVVIVLADPEDFDRQTVRAYDVNSETGDVALADEWEDTDSQFAGIAAGREHVYHLLAGGQEVPASIEVLSFDLLHERETQIDGFASANALDGANDAVLSPDGRHLYVPGLVDGAVQIFDRDAEGAGLDAAAEVREGVACEECLGTPRAVAVSPDGAHVYVGADATDSISHFTRDAASGALAFVATTPGGACALAGPSDLTVTPDGRDLLATASGGDAFCRFTRDAETGSLAFASAESGAGAGLLSAGSVTVSRDGRSVYVTAGVSDAVVHYSRYLGTGALSREEILTDAVGFDALDGASSFAISPDGHFAYASAFAADAVAVFSRDPATGSLTQIDAEVNGEGAVTGLDAPSALALSPDGRTLVVATADGVVAFQRDLGTGLLGFAQAAATPSGLNDVVWAPRGAGVYFASPSGDRVDVYVPEPGPALLGGLAALVLAGLRRARSSAASYSSS